MITTLSINLSTLLRDKFVFIIYSKKKIYHLLNYHTEINQKQ